MEIKNKATRIDLFSLKTPQMRAFHMTWFAFFLCFFAWFGIAPLMVYVREELSLTKAQIGNTIIASVAITILARLFIGWLCDRVGPRLTYVWLLIVGSIPVMAIGLAQSYEALLLFRLGIGVIGASFVITQYHTSVMFAPNCVGTANATSAGWGNLGGGVTNMVMPLVFAGFVGLGANHYWGWRLSMLVAGGVCFVTGIAYYFFTTDLPDGNFKELREKGLLRRKEAVKGTFALACKDRRVWALFLVYAACFGIELTINNIAAIYYHDRFELSPTTAGLVAGLFGLMNIFARTTGGIIGDKFAHRGGLSGRVRWLFMALLIEGVALCIFSRMNVVGPAIAAMVVFSLFVQMSEGATYSVVPFINKKALGSVAGIVGAGGNVGAVAAGFLFRGAYEYQDALLILGVAVAVVAFTTRFVRFSEADETEAAEAYAESLATRAALAGASRRAQPQPAPADGAPAPAPAFAWLKTAQPMDILRVYLGIALMIKGVYFILDMGSLEALLGDSFGQGRTVIAWGVVLAHAVGGISLAMGFVTRIAAALNVLVLLGATYWNLSASSVAFMQNESLHFAVFVLFALVLLFWRGSGSFSIDYLLRSSDMPEPVEAFPRSGA